MRLLRGLQHWLSGTGLPLQVADFVPDTHPIRQWADTFPWAALVAAIAQSFAQRFPQRSPRGRRPVPIRVLLALELLKHARGGQMRLSATVCARTLPCCTPVACMRTKPLARQCTLCSPRRSARFVAVSTRHAWMS